MKDILDIYTKLIIAVISFFAPLILQSLAITLETKQSLQNKIKEMAEEYERLYSETPKASWKSRLLLLIFETDDFALITLKANKKSLNHYEKLNRMLNVKKQIKFIFFCLFTSLILLLSYYVFKKRFEIEGSDNIIYNVYFTIVTICCTFSVVMFVLGVVRLKNVAWAIVDIKHNLKFDDVFSSTNKLNEDQEVENNDIEPISEDLIVIVEDFESPDENSTK